MNNIPPLIPFEVLHKTPYTDSGNWKRPIWRMEQKSVPWMEELLVMFPKPGALVMDAFVDTLSTKTEYLSVNNHRRFIGCHIYMRIVLTWPFLVC